MRFRDRAEAGRHLAGLLQEHAGRPDVTVLALPRGGVPVGYEVAVALGAPLDVVLVRKLGVPGHPELAMGALAHGGARVLVPEVIRAAGVRPDQVEAVAAAEAKVLAERARSYRGERPEPPVEGRTVVLVDDGLATGATMSVAASALRSRSPASLVVAVPVAPAPTCAELRTMADEVVCAFTPRSFVAVGEWYEDFGQVTDEEVRLLLDRAFRGDGAFRRAEDPTWGTSGPGPAPPAAPHPGRPGP